MRLDGVVTDITDRKQAEEALRASEERFRTLVEKSADAMALVDSQAQIIYASPSTQRVLGFTAEEFVGRNALEAAAKTQEQLAIKGGRYLVDGHGI